MNAKPSLISSFEQIAEVIIVKQRNGPTGTVKLMFDNKITAFKNLACQADAI